MARPKGLKSPIEISVSTCLTKDDFEILEKLAAAQKKGRSTIVRQALRRYAESFELTTAA